MAAQAKGREATQDAEELQAVVARFLSEHPRCVLLEAGEVLFDLGEASHRLECTAGKVLLHVWSDERNQVRRLMSATRRGQTLRMTAQRFGRKEPGSLELVEAQASRSPGTRDAARETYRRLLARVLPREFGDETMQELRSTMDLEHSFGPAYARGLMVRGQKAWAVMGTGPRESPATVDAMLTIGLLWLAYCRERSGGRRVVEGLRIVLPQGMAATTMARLAWLDRRIATYEVYELDEVEERLRRVDVFDRGNVKTRLLQAPNEQALTDPQGRFASAIPRVLALLPKRVEGRAEDTGAAHRRLRMGPATDDGFEMRLRSSAELAFLRHGLEFARIHLGFSGQGFNREMEVTIGSGEHETLLTEENAAEMRERIAELFARRTAISPEGDVPADKRDLLFRLQPERWLESLLRANLQMLDPHLEASPVYVQVGALAGASDRGLLDLLAVTNEQRLAVIEVKAEEDLQLAMQGLDYWIRICDHHLAHVDPSSGLGDLQRHGYFPGTRLLADSPLLYLVAPALRIHPATETILRHFDPRVHWTLVALDERWRQRVRPVWQRRWNRRHDLVEGRQEG